MIASDNSTINILLGVIIIISIVVVVVVFLPLGEQDPGIKIKFKNKQKSWNS